jgi:CubicO group peptidase (beta-lactamase class C family)
LKIHESSPRGRAFAYSNLGYNIFGLVLDRYFEDGWQEVLRKEVFDPLGMRDTTAKMSRVGSARRAEPHELGPDGPERIDYAKEDSNMQAAGGHVTTAHDLSRYLLAEINGGRVEGRQVIAEAAIRETQRKQVDQDRDFGSFHRFGWGLGWDLATYGGETVLQRFGGFQGFHSHLSFMPARNIGVVVLANGGGASGLIADLVATHAYDRLLLKPVGDIDARLAALAASIDEGRAADARGRASRRARPQVTPLPREAYVGTYDSPVLGRMIWTLADDRLRVRMGVARSDAEVFNGDAHQMRVELTGSGTVVSFDVPAGATRPTGLRFLNQAFTRVE